MAGSLAIDRFRLTALAPHDHPAPDRLRAVLDRVDVRRLTRQIKAMVGDFRPDDGRVIVLRRLDLRFADARIDDPDQLARHFAEGMAAALARLSNMEPTETVAIFPSAAARIAAFAAAVSTGEAWGRWWFSDLEHLKVLPISSAIRVALLREPAILPDALAAIGSGDRGRIAASLSGQDGALLIEGLVADLPPGGDPEDWTEAFALPPTPRHWPVAAAMVHDVALLAACGARPVSRAVVSALRLRAIIERGARPDIGIQAIRAGSAKLLAATAPAADPGVFAPLLALPSEVRAEVATAFEGGREASPSPLFTPFGGMLMLWPHLPEIDAERLPAGPGHPAGLLSLLSLASLYGRRRSGMALEDSVIRAAFEVDSRAALEDLADWLAQMPATLFAPTASPLREAGLPAMFAAHRAQHRTVRALGLAGLADFARRLPGFAGASLPFLRDNLIGVGARVLVEPQVVRAVLDRPPLDVLLSISGLANRSVELRRGRRLELERAS